MTTLIYKERVPCRLHQVGADAGRDLIALDDEVAAHVAERGADRPLPPIVSSHGRWWA
jgi:hypothetical protein